jgi:hypothetical protein
LLADEADLPLRQLPQAMAEFGDETALQFLAHGEQQPAEKLRRRVQQRQVSVGDDLA